MQCCWAATVSYVSITAPIALCPLGRRTIGFWRAIVILPPPAGLRAYAIDSVASVGDLHLRYNDVVGVTLSDEPQLLPVNLVRRNDSQAITGHYLIGMLPQSDFPSVEEHLVASGRQVLPLVGAANLAPGDILGVAHAPLMCVPLDAMQHDRRSPALPSGPPAVTPISTFTASPLAAEAGIASRSSALLERLSPEQHASYVFSWERQSSHLHAVAFEIHGPGRTPLEIEQGGRFCLRFW